MFYYVSADGQNLASASDDKTILLWDTESGMPIGSPFKGHSGSIHAIAFTTDCFQLASASYDMIIRLWDVTSGTLIDLPFEGHATVIRCVAFNCNGRKLASGSSHGEVRLWEVLAATCSVFNGHDVSVASMGFSTTSMKLASAADGNIRLWDVTYGLFHHISLVFLD